MMSPTYQLLLISGEHFLCCIVCLFESGKKDVGHSHMKDGMRLVGKEFLKQGVGNFPGETYPSLSPSNLGIRSIVVPFIRIEHDCIACTKLCARLMN